MAVQSTSNLSEEMMTYYEKVFLARAMGPQVFAEGAQKRGQSKNMGKTIRFTRYTPLATVTTPLTEGSNPAEVSISAANVDATLAEYGNVVNLSRFLSLTSIDANNKEKIELLGQNMGETLDELVREELVTGATDQFAGSGAAITDVAVSDVLSAAEIRKAVRTLKGNKAREYAGKFGFMGKIQPSTTFDLQGDSVWQNAKTYSDVKDLYNGETGALHGVRFLESKDGKVSSGAGAASADVYHNIIHGAEAFGVYDLEGDKPQLHIVPNTQLDSANPTGRTGKAGWAGSFVTKTLNGDWIVDVQTGATA